MMCRVFKQDSEAEQLKSEAKSQQSQPVLEVWEVVPDCIDLHRDSFVGDDCLKGLNES